MRNLPGCRATQGLEVERREGKSQWQAATKTNAEAHIGAGSRTDVSIDDAREHRPAESWPSRTSVLLGRVVSVPYTNVEYRSGRTQD